MDFPRFARLTPPAPLSNFASLRGEGGAGKTVISSKTRLFSPSPRSGEAAELERGLGGEAPEAWKIELKLALMPPVPAVACSRTT